MGVMLRDFKIALGQNITEKNESLEKLRYEARYIKRLIKGLEEYLKLNQLDINKLKNYIFSIDGKIIYPNITKNVKENLKSVSSTQSEIFDYLNAFIQKLEEIQEKKEKHAEEIFKTIKLFERIESRINDFGEFKIPIDEEYKKEINGILTLMANAPQNNLNFKINDLKSEISKEMLNQTQEKTSANNMPKGLSEEQTKIYITAQQTIISISKNNITNVDDMLKDLVKELKGINDLNEIEACLDAVDTKSERLWMIRTLLEYYLKRIKQTRVETIQKYIDLYKKYTNQKQAYIEQKQEKKNLEFLKNKIKQIVETLKEDFDEFYCDLTERQHNLLNSYLGCQTNEKTQETLNREGLDNGFQIVYNAFASTQNAIKKYINLDLLASIDIQTKYIEQIMLEFDKYQAEKATYIKAKIESENKFDDVSNEPRKENSIIIYLNDPNGITELEKEVVQAKQFLPEDYRDMIFLINLLKRNDFSELFILRSRKVKSDKGHDKEKEYKIRRIDKRNIRIVYVPLNKNILKTDKPVYLIVTGGIKTDSKQAEVYNRANNLRETVINFIKKYENLKMSPEEIESYIQRQKIIEEQIIKAINPNGYGTK